MTLEIVLVDDDSRTWEIRDAFPVIWDTQGLLIGPYGWSHSETLEKERGDALAYDLVHTIQAQLTPAGELYVLPDGEMGEKAERLRRHLSEPAVRMRVKRKIAAAKR